MSFIPTALGRDAASGVRVRTHTLSSVPRRKIDG
jgi:hypothetical protein